MSVLFPKNTRIICAKCNSHILTFSQNVYFGDALCEAVIDQTQGQAPHKYGDPTNCKKCNENFLKNLMVQYEKID